MYCGAPSLKVIDRALGYGVDGVEKAEAAVGAPYIWAGELENVSACSVIASGRVWCLLVLTGASAGALDLEL